MKIQFKSSILLSLFITLKCFCRIHIEEINHTVLLHMTERMAYKHSEVLSAVLTNKACHTLAVYFLLNNKMKRLSKEYRVSLNHTL